MFSVEGLEVEIGNVRILRGVSMSIANGAMVGLIGRNGAGKTTFMRAIMGLLPARAGRIQLDDVALDAAPAQQRPRVGIGYMPEDRKLVPDFTVEENVRLPALASRLRDVTSRIEWIHRLMPEVRQMQERRASQLSGGQQKMVALARALMAGHRLLLLDEPFEGLAPALARRFAEVLAELRTTAGLSLLVADSDERHFADLLTGMYRIERGEVAPAEPAAGSR
jgi:branched-chain amino acid transport system ATP-binding protein